MRLLNSLDSSAKVVPADLGDRSSIRTLFETDGEENQVHLFRVTKWFMPNSKPRTLWELFIFIAIWYNSIVTPITIFIMSGNDTPPALVYIDVAFDFIFLIDTLLRFFLPYVDDATGDAVTNLSAIRRKYLGSWSFYINAVACVPILKTPLSAVLDDGQQTDLNRNFNVLRMIRIINFTSQFAELKKFLSRKDPVNESVFRMGVILFFSFLGMCIFGCVYFGWSIMGVDDICPPVDKFEEDILNAEMWVAGDFVITDVMDPNICAFEEPPNCNDCPQMLFFTRSVYYMMQTLFTIGYGDTVVPSTSVVEIAMACVFMIFGVFGYGLTIANMTSVLANLDVVSMRYRYEMDTIARWLSFRSVPEALKDRINILYTYLNRRQCGMLDDALFSDLPPKLTYDFAALHMGLITKVPFFNPKLRSEAFLSNIANALIQRVYTPNSIILYQHEKQRELIIVKNGRANVYIKGNNTEVGCLTPGDFMGDYQLLFGTVNQVGVKSHDFTEVIVLTYARFKEVMEHPDDENFHFEIMAGNFRNSEDQGAMDTIHYSTKSLTKISLTVSSIKNTKRNKKLGDMIRNEGKLIVKGLRIYPNSKVHVARAIFTIVAAMYYSIICPVRIAYLIRQNNLQAPFNATYILDLILDGIFIIDMIFKAKVYAYVSFDNDGRNVIADRDSMTRHYVQSRSFKLDLFSVIPFDVISAFVGYESVARIPKIARVLQIPQAIWALRSSLDESMQVTVNETHVSILLMFLFSVLIIVWSSAGWNAIRIEESAYESVYWSLTTLTTVGYGDLTPANFRQTIYALFVGAFGAVFAAAIIANVTSFFHDVEISDDNIEHKINCIKCFMETHNSSFESIKKIQDYFNYIEREQDGLNEELLLNKSVPDNIKTNLLVHITQSMVLNCIFFAECDAGFLRRVMISLEQRFFGSQFIIINASRPADGMYFVKKGIVHIMQTSSTGTFKANKKVEADENFAEECLLGHYDANPFLAMAATDCELWFLGRSTFNHIIDDFPHLRPLFHNAIKTPIEMRRASMRSSTKANELMKLRRNRFIHPDGYFIQVWFVLILFVTVYSLIAIPYQVAFTENRDITFAGITIDYLGDIIYLIDIVIRSKFLAYYDDNHLVTDRREIWSHYKTSGNMRRHILAILPIEIIVIFVPSMCPLWSLQFWSVLRINKVIRSLEIAYLFDRVESTVASAGVKVPKNLLKVGKLIMLILLLAHWAGCIFFMIANVDQHLNAGTPELQNNWANVEGLLKSNPTCPGAPYSHAQTMRQYIASLYWAMATLTTVGYGDITATLGSAREILFATALLIVGTAAYTLVIASLEDIVTQLDVTSSLYQRKVRNVDTYMRLFSLPDGVKAKITGYYEALWPTQKGVKGKKLFGFVPRSLRSELKLDIVSPLLNKTFFIKDCKTDFIVAVVNSLTFEMYIPDDVLFYEGEKCHSLWYLCSGEVDYLTAQKVKFQSVSNCLIGECSFFGFEPYVCTAKAVDKCEVFFLTMQDFLNHLEDYNLIDDYVDYLELHQDKLSRSKASIVKMTQNLNSSKMAKMMVTTVEQTSIPKGVILPDTKFRKVWDIVALTFVTILAISIPLEISFEYNGISLTYFIIDSILDLFFILDIYARLSRFAIIRDGFLITSRAEFRKVYFAEGFYGDLLSVTPASFFGYATGLARGQAYGFLRLFQLVRVQRFEKYMNSFFETLNTDTNLIISTGLMRTIQTFLLTIFLCHWLACAYHFIGHSATDADDNWLAADQILSYPLGKRYLRAFYWALYTVTTVGYGSVPVISIAERIFAMVVMLVGAVLCDAGITAILTAIVSEKDHQAGTNNRRIQCCKTFMKNMFIPKDLQDRVLDYYNYIDTELQNIDEEMILEDLSSSLKSEIIALFCFDSLRRSVALESFSDGAVISMLKNMVPYLAIPGENISEIGKESKAIYVLQRGRMTISDSVGPEEIIPAGGLIGHIITKATEQKEGLPAKWLLVEVASGQGLKGKPGDPYVVIDCGSKQCRSEVIKDKYWFTRIRMKITRDCQTAKIRVVGWRKNNADVSWGVAETNLSDKIDDFHKLDLLDESNGGKQAGTIRIRLTCFDFEEDEFVSNHELTATAQGYCHLYRMDTSVIDDMKTYLARSKLPDLKDRIPIYYKNRPRRSLVTDDDNDIDIPPMADMSPHRKPSSADALLPRPSSSGAQTRRDSTSRSGTICKSKSADNMAEGDQDILQNEPRRITQVTKDWDNLVDFADSNRITNETLTERCSFYQEWDTGNSS